MRKSFSHSPASKGWATPHFLLSHSPLLDSPNWQFLDSSLYNFPAFSYLGLAFQCPFQRGSRVSLSFLLPFSCHTTKILRASAFIWTYPSCIFPAQSLPPPIFDNSQRLLLIKHCHKCLYHFQRKMSIFLEIKQEKKSKHFSFWY